MALLAFGWSAPDPSPKSSFARCASFAVEFILFTTRPIRYRGDVAVARTQVGAEREGDSDPREREVGVSNRIFFFTGSGNALAIAKSIAAGIGGADVTPMAQHIGGFDASGEERVGIVCPVYAWGPPRMVREFVEGLKLSAEQYVFAVTTCGGTPGKSAVYIDKWIQAKGGRLDAGFNVRGDTYAAIPGMSEIAIVKLAGWLGRNHVPKQAKERMGEISEMVKGKKSHKVEKSNASVNLLASLIYSAALGRFRKIDKGFGVTDACVSCGTCAKVCPRGNVRLVDGKPTWHQDCESCYACFLRCPQKAITYQGHPPNEPTHHPDASLAEILIR